MWFLAFRAFFVFPVFPVFHVFAVFATCLTSGLLWADSATVLVQAASAPALDYRATLKAHADLISPTREYLNRHPLANHREMLVNAFAQAQKAFLENSNAELYQKLKSVIDLEPIDDWAKGDREIFLYVYLRLAQIEANPERRDHWLARSLLVGADLKPDANLFPPPLLERWNQLANTLPRITLTRTEHLADWNAILINGIPCETRICGHWPQTEGRVRVTFVSDIWVPQTTAIELSKWSKLRPAMIPWAEGECARERWNQAAQSLLRKRVFWGLSCNMTSVPSEAKFLALPTPPTTRTSTANSTASTASTSATSTTSPTTNRPFYESKWFWIAVGGTIAALAVVNNSRPKEIREPTTTYGY